MKDKEETIEQELCGKSRSGHKWCLVEVMINDPAEPRNRTYRFGCPECGKFKELDFVVPEKGGVNK